MKKGLTLLTIFAIMILISMILVKVLDKSNDKGDNQEKNLSVVTSFYPTYILMQNLTDGIDEIKVESLTDFSAGCLHDYQLTTGDMKLLSKADLFIMNGGGMEGYIEDVSKNYPTLQYVDSSEDIIMIPGHAHENYSDEDTDHEEEDPDHEEEDHDDEEHDHSHQLNPHVWLDPAIYRLQIENAGRGLIQYILKWEGISESRRTEIIDKITKNEKNYLEQVLILEDKLEVLESGIATSNVNRKVVIFHEAFEYLAQRLGLEVEYVVEVDADTALSAGEIAHVINLVKEEGIELLFTEEQYGIDITKRISEETGVAAYLIDSGVTGDGAKDSYIRALEKNIRILEEALVSK